MSKSRQTAIIVSDNVYKDGLRDLNNLLLRGYKVVHTCPMPSSVGGETNGNFAPSYFAPSCLVIVEEPNKE